MRALSIALAMTSMLAGCDDGVLPTDTKRDDVGCDADYGTADAGDCRVDCGPSEWRDPATGICSGACSIILAVASRGSSEKTVDCGSLPRTADSDARTRALRCVLDAQSSGRPFKLIEWLQGIDSYIAQAYVGAGGSEPATYLEFDSYGGGQGTVGGQSCRALRAEASCVPSATSTCIECVGPGEFSSVCSGPTPSSHISKL